MPTAEAAAAVSPVVTAPTLGIVQPVGATGRGLGFSLAGIPVRIEPAFLVIIAVLGINPADPQPLYIASWVLIATVSVLVHELGHAVVFRVFGIRPAITLHGFGGLTSGSGGLTPWREIGVSLAGPLSALVLLGLPAVWLGRSGIVTSDEVRVFVSQAVWINIGWSLLNLVPVLPLDGGHVLEALAEMVARGRGRRIAAFVSVAVAAGLGLLALRHGLVFGALFAAMFAGINLTELSRAKQAGLAVRVNSNGQGNLIHDRDITGELAGAADVVSVSVNTADPAQYQQLCQSRFGERAYDGMLDFIRKAKAAGLRVVVTAVTVPGVDVEAVGRLAAELGVEFRGRKYQELG